ncbi:hypothetical protein LOAG_02672 [Loa loa]|uniref:Uncharacterized protein n=1 Tax=Loa loa TaxID=7209 RepID=A0A1S0U6N1_LOALO|nr:hypothetical protein LOAG_02672 [Loa loa]EFO25810.1 hypothetical protein LOAG_02672 [Loa loa]
MQIRKKDENESQVNEIWDEEIKWARYFARNISSSNKWNKANFQQPNADLDFSVLEFGETTKSKHHYSIIFFGFHPFHSEMAANSQSVLKVVKVLRASFIIWSSSTSQTNSNQCLQPISN